jgi:hypothetical protein
MKILCEGIGQILRILGWRCQNREKSIILGHLFGIFRIFIGKGSQDGKYGKIHLLKIFVLGSGFITFSCWFLKTLFTLLKTFVKQMAFFLCYSYSVTHICSIIYRNHEVLPKPQMSEEFNYKCNNNLSSAENSEIRKNARSLAYRG